VRDTASKWLGRRPTWQFALIWGLAIAAGCVLGGILGQLWKHHFDWPELLGMAAGGAIGGSFAATAIRWNERESSKLTLGSKQQNGSQVDRHP
jgi:uncharacterized membrane protein YfcA